MNNPELLKCPCCGNLPEIYGNNGWYWCNCTHYACDWPYAITVTDKADAIKGWNNAVLEYKGSKK